MATSVPNTETHASDELTWVSSAIPSPLFNFVLRARLNAARADAAIDAAIARSRQRGIATTWIVTSASYPPDLAERLEGRGFAFGGETPIMQRDLRALPDEPPPPEVAIGERRSAAEIAATHAVCAEAFAAPAEAAAGLLAWLLSLPVGPGTRYRLFGAVLDGREVATATAARIADAALVFNVATLDVVRRHGVGRAVTAAVLRAARDEGSKLAVLAASPLGEPLYAALGFATAGGYRAYRWEPQPQRPTNTKRPAMPSR